MQQIHYRVVFPDRYVESRARDLATNCGGGISLSSEKVEVVKIPGTCFHEKF